MFFAPKTLQATATSVVGTVAALVVVGAVVCGLNHRNWYRRQAPISAGWTRHTPTAVGGLRGDVGATGRTGRTGALAKGERLVTKEEARAGSYHTVSRPSRRDGAAAPDEDLVYSIPLEQVRTDRHPAGSVGSAHSSNSVRSTAAGPGADTSVAVGAIYDVAVTLARAGAGCSKPATHVVEYAVPYVEGGAGCSEPATHVVEYAVPYVEGGAGAAGNRHTVDSNHYHELSGAMPARLGDGGGGTGASSGGGGVLSVQLTPNPLYGSVATPTPGHSSSLAHYTHSEAAGEEYLEVSDAVVAAADANGRRGDAAAGPARGGGSRRTKGFYSSLSGSAFVQMEPAAVAAGTSSSAARADSTVTRVNAVYEPAGAVAEAAVVEPTPALPSKAAHAVQTRTPATAPATASSRELFGNLSVENSQRRPVFDSINFPLNPYELSSRTTADLHLHLSLPQPFRATAAVCRRGLHSVAGRIQTAET